MIKYDVFISHSSADLELAEVVYDYLQEQGIKCWIDSRNVSGLYARSIIEGIKQSELMLLIYSGKANSSKHVENEIDNAFCLGKIIIPFRIEGMPYSDVLQYYLNKSHYVDGMPEPRAAFEQLRDQIRRNMSEQKRLETIDEAFKVVAQWANIDVDLLRKMLKAFKRETATTSADRDTFEQKLQNFIQQELTAETNNAKQKGATEDTKQTTTFNDASNTIHSSGKGGNSTKRRYDMLQNAAGEILIIINDEGDKPENPRIVYDGSETALLYRNKNSASLLNKISQEAREALMKVDEVLVVEIKDDDVSREYKVPIRKIKSLRALY